MSISVTSVTDSYNDLLTSTLSKYMPKMREQILRGTPLLWWLEDKKRKRSQRGGYDIRIPVSWGQNTTVQHFSGYDIVDITPSRGLTMAVYNWRNMVVSISISQDEELKNAGQYKLLDLLGYYTTLAEKSIRVQLNDELHGLHGTKAKTFTGGETNTVDSAGGTAIDTGYKSFNSLDNLVRSAWGMIDNTSTTIRNHTVGGITVGITGTQADAYPAWGDMAISAYSNPYWMNQTNPGFGLLKYGTSSGPVEGGVPGARLSANDLLYAGLVTNNTNLALAYAMLEMYTRLSTDNDPPDVGLTSPEVYNLYEISQVPQERYMDRRVADAGFENLRFKGMTLMPDHGIYTKLAASGHAATAPAVPMYFLNSNYMWWVTHPDADFKQTPFVKPEDQLARTAQIVLMAQLCCDNRGKQGHLSLATIATNGWSATS